MRELYFEMYTRFVYNKFYYEIYCSSASSSNFWICVLTCLASASGISGWFIWKQFPIAWAVLLGSSQIINAISGYLPFNKRISAANYFVSEIDCLINKVEDDWRLINCEDFSASEAKISKLIGEYQKQFTEIDHRYIKGDLFPYSNKFKKKATENRDKFFKNKYGDDKNVQQDYPAKTTTAGKSSSETSKENPI